MKYIFWGSPIFAEIVLKELIDSNFPPVAIVTNPDRPFGRKKIIKAPETKSLILNYNNNFQNKIEIYQPEKIDKEFENELRKMDVDLFIVAAYSKIIPQSCIDIPKFGVIGVHPSLLPKYRGTSPIQSALLNGEKETGVTIYKMDKEMDHGDIIFTEKIIINEDDNYESLIKKLGKIGGQLAVKTISDLQNAINKSVVQNHNEATFTKKFKIEDGYIDPEELYKAMNENFEVAEKILNKIKALNPEPGTWTIAKNLSNKSFLIKDGERIKILNAKIINQKLVLIQIQREGQKPILFQKI